MAVAVAIANTGLDHRASRQECCGAFASAAMPAQMFKCRLNVESHMPILLWLIGVPISIIVLLMLFGVLHI
jgi:hypothetical protein